MVRGSMVAREINFEEKRVHMPTLMVQEPFFSLPVTAAPTVQGTVVTAPVVISLVTTINEHEESILQDPIELVVAHEEEQQQPYMEQAPTNEAPRRSQIARKSAIPDDYEFYECEEFQIEGDPTSFEEAMEDEMKSIKTNGDWDLETISKGAKTVG